MGDATSGEGERVVCLTIWRSCKCIDLDPLGKEGGSVRRRLAWYVCRVVGGCLSPSLSVDFGRWKLTSLLGQLSIAIRIGLIQPRYSNRQRPISALKFLMSTTASQVFEWCHCSGMRERGGLPSWQGLSRVRFNPGWVPVVPQPDR